MKWRNTPANLYDNYTQFPDMENLRYLLVAIAALTLIMSVVSSVNPSYFVGLNAYADHEDDEEDDDNSGSSTNDEENEQDDEEHEDDDNDNERKLEQTLGNHSKATLEVDEDAELEIEIEEGDLDDGIHDITFACNNTDVSKEFADSLNVTDGHGDFEADLGLSNGTYTGCEVDVGELSATFPTFNIMPDEEHDEEDEEEHDDDNEDNDTESSSGSNRHDDEDEEDEDDDDNSGRGSQNQGSAEEKRKERKERIVSTTSGAEIHERHRNANPHSPGEYDPGWNYTLTANGTAIQPADDEGLLQEENATLNANMSIWKSNRAIILFDVVGGTVEIADQDYTIRIGYAIYSLHHDAIKVVALGTDDDGNVYKLRLRGNAVNEGDPFPMESGSIDLLFGGNVDQSNNRFEDWSFLLEGTVEAS